MEYVLLDNSYLAKAKSGDWGQEWAQVGTGKKVKKHKTTYQVSKL